MIMVLTAYNRWPIEHRNTQMKNFANIRGAIYHAAKKKKIPMLKKGVLKSIVK